MPSPSSTLATQRPDLATFQEFDLEMNQRGLVASQVFPVLEVAKQAGNFGKIPIEQLLQARTTNRAPGGGYNRGQFTFTPASYACEEHGAEEPVDDREAAMYADYFNAEQISAARAYSAVLTNAEKRVADLLFNETTFAAHHDDITDEWDDYDAAKPIDDVEAAVQAVWAASGLWPNALVINRKVFRNLRQCEQIIERIASMGAGDKATTSRITAQQLAECFDLPYIIVAGTAQNTANEGAAASLSSIWSDEYALVCKVATSNDMREPCLGRTFHWAEDGSQIGGTFESYRDESVRSDIIRVRHDVDEVLLYTEAGHLLTNATTI